jgi:hypothetical protein
VTSIDGSAVTPPPAVAAVCDSAVPPKPHSSSEAALHPLNIDFANTDIVGSR